MPIVPTPEIQRTVPLNLKQEERGGLSRIVTQIHWLLISLVLLYLVFGGKITDGAVQGALTIGLFFYVGFVAVCRYAPFVQRETNWKIAIETWAMIALITWVINVTDSLSGPMVNSYLLPVITAALTLGRLITLAQVGLIAACYLYLGGGSPTERLLSLAFYGEFGVQLAPVLLAAYIVTMFSTEIRFGLNRAKLQAETDELTGLPNLRGFSIASQRLFAHGVRYRRESSILMIDSDNLKLVNDNHGHEAGNKLIKQLAMVICEQLRDADVPARYGGDEFIVFLSEAPLKGALIVAERIREAMAVSPLDIDGKQVGCTVSIGVAGYPMHGITLDAIASCADRALYEAKKSGRNRVAEFSGD